MRPNILFLVLVPGLLLSFQPPSQAAGKGKAAAKADGYGEIPAINWKLTSTGFVQVFKHRNEELESAEPGRFFPGAVAFALGRVDESGHFLMLNCGASQNCSAYRDALEERLVAVSFLDAVHTPKVSKDALYSARTWELTALGYKYMDIAYKRHPDLYTRLGRLVGSAFASR